MFTNKYDVVETNKMAMEDVASLIDGERTASTDLENGRLVVRDGEKYKYASAGETQDLFLVTTPERLYLPGGKGDFYNPEGRLIRAVRVVLGDIFSTTAVEGEVKVGDTLVAGKDGKLVAGKGTKETEGVATGVVFEVKGKRMLENAMGVTVERIK